MLKIKDRIERFVSWKRNIFDHQDKIDIGRSTKVAFHVKLKYNLLGFTEQNYTDYNLAENDYHQYISYDERIRLDNANGRFAYALGEKLTFERNFRAFVNVPHIFWWNREGEFVDPDTGIIVTPIDFLTQEKIMIIKPTRSSGGGSGVHKIEYVEEKYLFDGQEITEHEMLNKLSSMKDYICVQFIRQAEYSKMIFPYTTNTIRIATGRLKDRGYEVLFSFHRFGSVTTGAVDNTSSGGVFAYIDENGIMSAGRSFLYPKKDIVRHPDTNVKIKGVSIPNWQSVCAEVINAHSRFPYLKFIAWDVVIGQDGKLYVIEINRGSDLSIQMIKPQRYEKLGQFMRENGMLSRRIDK